MANLNPTGIDLSDGQTKRITESDVLTDGSGNSLARPTTASWGNNTQALSGNLTLTDTSSVWQILDPNGADRVVTLPIFSTANPAFVIVNDGLYLIDIVDSNGLNIWNLLPNQSVKVISNGTSAWSVVSTENCAKPLTGQRYLWGGSPGVGNFFRVNMAGQQGGDHGTADAPGAYHVVQIAGSIDEMSWLTAAEATVEELTLYVNGAAQEAASATGGGGAASGGTGRQRYSTPISVSQGDRLAIQVESGTNEMQVQIRVVNSSSGYTIPFGGDISADNAFYRFSGNAAANYSVTTEDIDSSAILVGSGNLVSLAYAIQGAITTDTVDILIDGVEDQVVTLTNGTTLSGVLYGIETLTGSFSAGNTLAIRGNIAANLNDSVLSILTDVAAFETHNYKGNPGANACFNSWHSDAGTGGVAFTDNDARTHIRSRGRVSIGWNATNTPTGNLYITKNMNESHTFDWTTGATGTADLSFTVIPGDTLSFCSDTGGEGSTNLLVLIR